jgi:hypothetical protein
VYILVETLDADAGIEIGQRRQVLGEQCTIEIHRTTGVRLREQDLGEQQPLVRVARIGIALVLERLVEERLRLGRRAHRRATDVDLGSRSAASPVSY